MRMQGMKIPRGEAVPEVTHKKMYQIMQKIAEFDNKIVLSF